RTQVPTAHRPRLAQGTNWNSTNTECPAIGLINEKATRHSVHSELNQRIIKPLGLRHTSFPSGASINGPHAHGYLFLGKPPLQDATTWSASFAGAAGGPPRPPPAATASYKPSSAGNCSTPTSSAQWNQPSRHLPARP